MTDILIPDVSEFQSGNSAPNWAGIKAQNGGAGICRVGYGNAHLDAMFVNNYTALKSNGFQFIGLYHYLVAGQDALSQAKAFCNWVGPVSAVYPGTVFILDLEEGSGDQSGRANTWLNYVDQFYGLDQLPLNQRSWLYSYTSFVNAANLGALFASARHTWIASYGSTEPAIGHTLWQSTDGSLGSHITSWLGAGHCDTSIAHHSLSELAAMGFGGATVSTPATPYHGEYITGGMFDLADLAAKLGVGMDGPATLLRMTASHYGTFGNVLGPYLRDILTGVLPWNTPVPAGVAVWCD